MRVFPIWLCVAIAACSPASPRFLGVTPERVDAGEFVFDVYRKDQDVQVVRTNIVVLPDQARAMTAAVLAAEAVTGCRAERGSIRGDAAIVTLRISCRAG